jgi:hypothetical protein
VRKRTEHGAREANHGRFTAFPEVKWVSQRWSSGSLLIAAGALGLAYGSFSYTKRTNSAHVGPIVLGVLLPVAFRSK